VHNIQLQQLRKKGASLYGATINDYVWTFKQMKLYYLFKKGGQFGQGLDRSELFLHKATQYGDLTHIVDAVWKYAPHSTFTTIVTH